MHAKDPINCNTNPIFDLQVKLYEKATNKKPIHNLFDKVGTRNNILYAIERIKDNPGRNTPGPNGMTFEELMKMPFADVVNSIKEELKSKEPKYAKEVQVPKDNGKYRKLGITNIENRIAQQCVLNILECIVEPQFANKSYGFRRNLSAKHCVSRMATTMITMKHEKWVYDCDLENYFGSVKIDYTIDFLRKNHNIRDTKFLELIKRLLWLNIKKRNKIEKYEGIGLVQGSILGPVLANVMLNDFEQILKGREGTERQKSYSTTFLYDRKKYKNIPTKEDYIRYRNKSLGNNLNVTMFRYADDFIFLSNNQYDLEEAIDIFRSWCEKYELKINKDKTKIINGYDVKLDFAGYHIRIDNRKGMMISIKNYNEYKRTIVKKLKTYLKQGRILEINCLLNGILYYYDIATNLTDFIRRINKVIDTFMRRRVRKYSIKIRKEIGHEIYHITNNAGKKTKIDLWNLRNRSNKSTKEYIMNTVYWKPDKHKMFGDYEWTQKIIDNRLETSNTTLISFLPKIIKNQKKEPILGIDLTSINPDEIHLHHKRPLSKGGKDEYNNLVLLSKRTHTALHSGQECDENWDKTKYDKLLKLIKE